MKKIISKFSKFSSFIICVVILLVTNVNVISAVASDLYVDPALLEAEFADDHVLVAFTNKSSLLFKQYTPADFEAIGCEQIYDLSIGVTSMVKKVIDSIESYIVNGNKLELYNDINVGEYNKIVRIKLKEKGRANVIKAIKTLQKREDVLFAEPDYYTTSSPDSESNDPLISQQWAISKIQLEQAWLISEGSEQVLVGVADTGIEGSHPDLINRINTQLSRDFTNNGVQGGLTDEYPHGTKIAGVIGAKANSIGIRGVCQNVQLVSLKAQVPDSNGKITGLISYLASAIDYAEANGIRIISASIGWSNYSQTLEQSLEQYTGLLVCSAGNDTMNADLDSVTSVPLKCQNGTILSVGASTIDDTKRTSSNWGKETVDIFAPGQGIITTEVNNSYVTTNGTSLAAPYVAGVAALLLSAHPELTAEQLKSIIIASADPVAAFANICVSGGRLNAYEALKTASIHQLSYSADASGTSHTATCATTTCNYSFVEDHNNIITNINNATSHRNTCTDCGYTSLNMHSFSVDASNSETHSLSCDDCGYSFSETHDMDIQSTLSATEHDVICLVCNYSYSEEHSLYVLDYADDNNDGIEDYREWMCNDCGYSYVCNHNFNMRSEYDTNGHYHVCSDCGFRIMEDHIFTKTPDSLTYHKCECMCDYSYMEEHIWRDYTTYYQCIICGKTSTVVPDIQLVLPPIDEEEEITE